MKIEVTQEDIDKGQRGDGIDCPVAIAIHRTTGIDGIFAGPNVIRMGIYGDYEDTPAEVTGFMARFDAGKPVKPFSFEL